MRKIKFRGKSVKTKKWVYGSFIPENDGRYWINTDGMFNSIEVMSDSVGQFTGLHDRNGKEIYEGDLITNTDVDITHLKNVDYKLFKFREDRAAFCIASTVDLKILPDFDNWQTVNPRWWADYRNKYQVKGNIYDNPELIKGIEI